MRKRLFEIIEVSQQNDRISHIYDIIMIVVIVVSLIPLTQPDIIGIFSIIDKVTVVFFIVDYFLRLITADYKLNKGMFSFLVYPFTPMAIVDLLSILPSLSLLPKVLKTLRLLRLLRALRVVRVFKTFRYSKNIAMIGIVFKKQKDSLIVVGWLAAGYILISALIIYSVEPESFPSFFDAIYWATVSLTTVGYGDIYAVSTVGKIITMISSVFGIAVVALPAGILTAGYMNELANKHEGDGEDITSD